MRMGGLTNADTKFSSQEGKDSLGRDTFFRTTHLGQRGNPTEHAASIRLDAANTRSFTWLEKLMLRNANPSLFNALKGAGWSEDNIYEHLNSL